jgi:DNA-binding transcriptional LysR family regulator
MTKSFLRIHAGVPEQGQTLAGIAGRFSSPSSPLVANHARGPVVVDGGACGHSALPRFAARHPGLRIELLIDDKQQDLIVEGVHIALRFGAMADSNAVARKIMSTPRLIVASPTYLQRAGLPQAPQDLASHQAVFVVTGIGAAGWTFRRTGHDDVAVRIDGQVTANQNEAAVAAAVAGLGILATTRADCGAELLSDARRIAA